MIAEDKNQAELKLFQTLIAQKYCKEYHIVDNPALSYSLARKSLGKQQKINIKKPPILERAKMFQTSKQKSNFRSYYDNLKKDIKSLLDSVYNCLQNNRFALSQFFQYQQLILGGFMQNFINQLTFQCRQKGQFLQYVWTQNIKLVYKMLQYYERIDYKFQVNKNTELYQVHAKYNTFMQKQTKKIKQQNQQIYNLKSIIQILVQKLRIRKKQVKKLFKQTQHLMVIVNQFRDKNIQLQYKYLSLIESNQDTNQIQIKQISQKKQKLNTVYSQILTLQNSLYKNIKPIFQEVNIQGPLQIQDFIKQASFVMHSPNESVQEVKAQIQILIDKIEQDFEDNMLKLKKTAKKRIFTLQQVPQNAGKKFLYEIHTPKVETSTISTQFGFTEKFDLNLIKSSITMTNQDLRRKVQHSTQYNCPFTKYRFFNIYKTVQVKLNFERPKSQYKPHKLVKKNNQRISIDEQDQDQILDFNQQEEQEQSQQNLVSSLKKNVRKKKQRLHNYKGGVKSRFSLYQGGNRKISSIFKSNDRLQQFKQLRSQSKKQKINGRSYSTSTGQNKIRQSKLFDSIQLINQNFSKNKQNIKQQKQRKYSNFKSTNIQKKSSFLQSNLSQNKRLSKNPSRFSKLSKFSVNQNELVESQNKQIAIKNNNFNLVEKVDKINNDTIKKIFEINYHIFNSSDENTSGTFSKIKNIKKQFLLQGGLSNFYISQTLQRKNKGKFNLIFQKKQIKINENERHKKLIQKLKIHRLKNKKGNLSVKHNNISNIIASIYFKAYEKIQHKNGYMIQNFIDPMYDYMMVLYGNLVKQQIEKKIINFLAQVSALKDNQICNSFAYFVGIDQTDKSCQDLTWFDNNLYLKLIKGLSNTQKPLNDIQEATTDVSRLRQRLKNIFRQQNIPVRSCDIIIKRIEEIIINQNHDQQKKLNLFYCCKLIIKQLVTIRKYMKDCFEIYFRILNRQKNQKQTLVLETQNKSNQTDQKVKPAGLQLSNQKLNKIVQLLSKTKIQQLQIKNKIQQICKKDQEYFNLNSIVFLLFSLQIDSFQNYYVEILTKFKILSHEKRTYLVNYRGLFEDTIFIKAQKKKALHEQDINEQITDILMLQQIDKESNKVLEELIGFQLTQFYGLSIVIFAGI